jgi:hypothetical protein
MILTFLNFNFTKGYIYETKKKKDGFDDDCLRYQTITNSTQNKEIIILMHLTM